VILNFLIDSSTKIIKLLGLSQKEAKREVSKYKNFDRCMDYVRNVIYPLIEYGNPTSIKNNMVKNWNCLNNYIDN